MLVQWSSILACHAEDTGSIPVHSANRLGKVEGRNALIYNVNFMLTSSVIYDRITA